MKKPLYLFAFSLIAVFLLLVSCNDQTKQSEVTAGIENTLQSVTYLEDSIGLNPNDISEALGNFNQAISEIGFPDAGYKLWINQEETSAIRFMVEGHWPDQPSYDLIHDHELYKNASEEFENTFESTLEVVEYHRFRKVK